MKVMFPPTHHTMTFTAYIIALAQSLKIITNVSKPGRQNLSLDSLTLRYYPFKARHI